MHHQHNWQGYLSKKDEIINKLKVANKLLIVSPFSLVIVKLEIKLLQAAYITHSVFIKLLLEQTA